MSTRRRTVVITEYLDRPQVPRYLRRLDVLCHNHRSHALPVKMKFVSAKTGRRGLPTAVYACPYPRCNRRQRWTQDRHGKTRRLSEGQRRTR
ncbi:hypothetical protein HOK31_27095 [Candidatus Poribacteria bacterium]|jgi:hypothetical protein|nr:hypothetical protein [Candidatus Poribacteria bacterium]MBT7808067.1 hypothetical protein [Candidatus Poribacteria bacterium]